MQINEPPSSKHKLTKRQKIIKNKTLKNVIYKFFIEIYIWTILMMLNLLQIQLNN